MTASDQSRGKKSMETGALNQMTNAVDIYYGTGVRITRAMKADMQAKSSRKNVSEEREAQPGAKKMNSVKNKLSERTSPRRKSATTKQNAQRKKQKSATSSAEQTKGMKSNQNEVQKDKKHNTPKQEKVTKKKHKPNPSNYEPSVRQMRVMRSLALVAPLGSPFYKR